MKRTLSYFLAAVMMLAMMASPTVSAISDISGDLTEKVPVLEMLGVISGYPDGTFKPERTLSRAEFSKMIVMLLGEEDQVGYYKSFTKFSDVKSDHWAVGVVNLSVALNLIKGLPDGTFRPDNPIKYSEAVTILMRALGYTDTDVGMLWPDGYMNKAASIGLTKGITGLPGASISRANGARIFYNMLSTKTKAGQVFISTISGAVREDAVILETSATAADGSTGAILIAGDASAIKSKKPMPSSFEGLRGTLVLDESGIIITFIPGTATKKSFILSESVYPRITASSGESYTLKSNTPVFVDGTQKTFLEVSYDLIPGTAVDIVFTAAGAIDYIIVRESGTSESAVILTATPSLSALESMLGASGGAKILKNGTLSTAADLRKHDVVTYSRSANIITATDFRLTGAFEYAYPNTTSPTKVTVLGTEFNVMPQAIDALAKFKLGDIITLLFTSDMRVAGAVSNSELSARAVGLYTGTAVELVGGPKINATSEDIDAGTLVRVYSLKPNTPILSEIHDTNPTLTIDMNAGTVGDKKLSSSAKFFEKVGSKGRLAPIDRSDITLATIPAGKVFYVGYDSSDRANIIVLDDVTGNSYEYGKLAYDLRDEEVPFGDTTVAISKGFAWVENSSGKGTEHETTLHQMPKGVWGGLAVDKTGRVSKYIELVKYTGITRQSFRNNNSIAVGGIYTQISDDVQVYLNATGSYLNSAKFNTLEELIIDARAFGSSFEVYTDKAPSDGGSIRIIIVK